ncbi:MAG: hypothetical protein SGILL_009936, partial [Bacillariaceae sp.]
MTGTDTMTVVSRTQRAIPKLGVRDANAIVVSNEQKSAPTKPVVQKANITTVHELPTQSPVKPRNVNTEGDIHYLQEQEIKSSALEDDLADLFDAIGLSDDEYEQVKETETDDESTEEDDSFDGPATNEKTAEAQFRLVCLNRVAEAEDVHGADDTMIMP